MTIDCWEPALRREAIEREVTVVHRMMPAAEAQRPEAVAAAIYRRVHCGLNHRSGRGPLGELPTVADQVRDTAKKLRGLEVRSTGWRMAELGDRTTLVDGSGVHVRVTCDQIEQARLGGSTWDLLSLPLGVDTGGRWMHWLPPTSATAPPPAFRVYVSAPCVDASQVWTTVLLGIRSAGKDVRAKMATSRNGDNRLDSLVFYPSARELPDVLSALREVDFSLLQDGSAGFAWPVQRGVGLASAELDAQSGMLVSYGYRWAMLYAHALIHSDSLSHVSDQLIESWSSVEGYCANRALDARRA